MDLIHIPLSFYDEFYSPSQKYNKIEYFFRFLRGFEKFLMLDLFLIISVIIILIFMIFVRKLLPQSFRPGYLLRTTKISNLNSSQQYQSHNKISTLNRNLFLSKPIFRFSDNKNNKIPQQDKAGLSRQERFKQKTQQMFREVPESQEDQVSYTKSQNKLAKYLMALSVVALLMAYGMMEVQGMRAQKKLDKSISGMTKVVSTGKAQIGGEWSLVDTKGQPYGSRDLEGSYYLIYFGFTNCPDICPNSLIKLSKALQRIRKMPEYQYLNLKTIFVSVDPDRDTPQKIDKFLSYFDKSFIGVTAKSNNDPNLKQCMKKFKIYASKIEFEDQQTVKQGRKSYTIDHTILTYLMSDDNEYLAHLGANLGEHELAKMIIEKIIDNQHEKLKLIKAA